MSAAAVLLPPGVLEPESGERPPVGAGVLKLLASMELLRLLGRPGVLVGVITAARLRNRGTIRAANHSFSSNWCIFCRINSGEFGWAQLLPRNFQETTQQLHQALPTPVAQRSPVPTHLSMLVLKPVPAFSLPGTRLCLRRCALNAATSSRVTVSTTLSLHRPRPSLSVSADRRRSAGGPAARWAAPPAAPSQPTLGGGASPPRGHSALGGAAAIPATPRAQPARATHRENMNASYSSLTSAGSR